MTKKPKEINIDEYPFWLIDLLETQASGNSPGLIQTHATSARNIDEAQEIANGIGRNQMKGHTRYAVITKRIKRQKPL